MLIVTTNAFANSIDLGDFTNWPGLRVLVVLPGSGLSRSNIERLNEDFIIIEQLEPVPFVAGLFADAIGWLKAAITADEMPLLYVNQKIDDGFMRQQIGRIHQDCHDCSATLSEDGRLMHLRLGNMIATSPLLPDLLSLLRGRDVRDETFVELLTSVFVQVYK